MASLSAPTKDRLIKECRIFLNQENPDNSFWSDEELTLYLNDAIRQYFFVVAENAEGQFDKQTDLSIVANTDTVALPTDCFEVRSLYKLQNDGFRILPYRNDVVSDYSTQGGTSAGTYEPYYFFRRENIVLRPVPNFSEANGLRLEYTAFPETLIWGGDVMSEVSPVFKELIILYAVYKAKVKESLVQGTDTSALASRMLGDTYGKFVDTVTRRSKYPTYVRPFTP